MPSSKTKTNPIFAEIEQLEEFKQLNQFLTPHQLGFSSQCITNIYGNPSQGIDSYLTIIKGLYHHRNALVHIMKEGKINPTRFSTSITGSAGSVGSSIRALQQLKVHYPFSYLYDTNALSASQLRQLIRIIKKDLKSLDNQPCKSNQKPLLTKSFIDQRITQAIEKSKRTLQVHQRTKLAGIHQKRTNTQAFSTLPREDVPLEEIAAAVWQQPASKAPRKASHNTPDSPEAEIIPPGEDTWQHTVTKSPDNCSVASRR